jgi:azurin
MKFPHNCYIFALIIATCANLKAEKSPKGFEKVDQEITISTLEAQMKYDVQSFSVKPNSKVKVIFKNPDSLPHNLIFCTPGKKKGGDKGEEVIDAVLKLGDKGVKMNWEPKGHPRILASSGMVQPGKETVIYFKVPKVEGNYPYICTFPGHYQLMNGMMGVTKKANPVTNLTYKLYHGKWSKMPDFSEFKAVKSGTLAAGLFDISMREVDDNFACFFNGKIECLKDGKYSFTLSSDDGSQLFINGKMIVDNDGVHGNQAKAGSVELKKGRHDIEVKYFELSGQQALSVSWSGPGFKNKPLSKTSPKPGQVVEGMLIEAPEGEASLYRNFIDGAGPRAIGVGYHEGVNLAFDANNMRLAMIWHGEFIDGARHWIGRGQGFQPPAGSDVIRLPEGVVISELEKADSSWPSSEYRTNELDFKGYVLDQFQRPTFKYSRGAVSITDKSIPVASASAEKPGTIRRMLKFSGGEPSSNLYLLLAQGKFQKDGTEYYNEEIFLSVKGGEILVNDGDLRVPIVFKNGKSEVEIIYRWTD